MDDSPFPSRVPLILLGSVVAGILLTISGLVDPSSAAKPVLRTLATVQGALFAIVFSIIILGVQMSANRYSPRTGELYRSDSAYLWTFIVFGSSIGVCLFGLYLLPTPGFFLRLSVISGGILAVVSFWTLYQFVGYILQQTTPEGLLKRIEDHLTPDYILEQAERAATDMAEPNPFLIIVSTINSAIEDGDDTTATIGLKVIGRRTRNALVHVPRDPLEENSSLTEVIEELCTIRLVSVAHNALANSLYDVAEEALDTFQTIAEEAADTEADHIVIYAFKGLFEITGTIGFGLRADRVRKRSIETGVDTLHTVVEHERWEALGNSIRVMGWRIAESIQERSDEAHRDAGYGSLFIRWGPSIFEEIINRLDVEVRDEDIDWISGMLIAPDEMSDEESVLHAFLLAMAEVTSAVIRYQIETGEPLVRWQYVARGWSKCFEAVPEDLTSLRSTWLSVMLYIDYLLQNLDDDQSRVFQREIRRAVSGEFVDMTIDKVLSSELDPTGPIDMIPGIVDPTEVPALTGISAPPDVEEERNFENWLELQSGMRSRFQSGSSGSSAEDFLNDENSSD